MSSLVESLSMLNKVPEMLDVSDDVMMMSFDVTRTGYSEEDATGADTDH